MLEIQRVYDLQKANRWAIAQTSAKERIEKLKRLREALWQHRSDIQQALYSDFKKNPGEADLTDFLPVISEINHTIKHLSSWMKPKRVGTPKMLFGTSSAIYYEAKGMVLILSPWNYPFNLSLNPVVAALAAGNCIMLKPSSKVPHAAAMLREILGEVFEEREVAVFEGRPEVSEQLLKYKFDHIFFTGSTGVGKRVMKAASEHLTPVTLELGGKSPVIVDETADIVKSAERIMWGKFLNAGQTCVAPDYLMVHKDKVEEFISASISVLEKRYGKTAQERKQCDSFCRLVTKKQLLWLKGLLDASVAQGAKLAFGGGIDSEDRYLEPTLLTNVAEDSPVMKEELFGPILPIMTYKHLDEAIRVVQNREKPLALYIFSKSGEGIERVLRSTSSGGTCVNTAILHLANPDLPFGGVGESGMGNYHGFHGFRNLSHERAVLKQKSPDILTLFYPPYTERVKRSILAAARYIS
ncbi:MAG: aldehyde dehydrogenase family protein [Myxococcota bacterium]|nr:aldehyde dehydrogenase family protein [Myxococcota bacterium]